MKILMVLFGVSFLVLVFLFYQPAPIAPTGSAPPQLSEAEKVKRGCVRVHLMYDTTPMDKLSYNELKLLQFCIALGY